MGKEKTFTTFTRSPTQEKGEQHHDDTDSEGKQKEIQTGNQAGRAELL